MDIFGSAGNDILSPTTEYQRVLGLDGVDTLLLGAGFEGVLLSGGKGGDRYALTSTLTSLNYILDGGNGTGDSFDDGGFLRNVNYIAELDGRHLIMVDSRTGGGVIFIDWQSTANRIESWTVSFLLDIPWPEASFKSLIANHYMNKGVVSLDSFGADVAQEIRRDIALSTLAVNTAGDANAVRDTAQQMLVGGRIVTPQLADGSFGLEWVLLADSGNDVVIGTSRNDFINANAGNDAVDGGAGNDILDGGTGSNFLTGGSGSDTFFIDGRSADGAAGRTVWSTITDFTKGLESVTIWGWVAGKSRVIGTPVDGADGYKGATWHIDLTGDGVVDASVTLSNVQATGILNLTGVSGGAGYLMLG